MNATTVKTFLNRRELAGELIRPPFVIYKLCLKGKLPIDARLYGGQPLFDASKLTLLRQIVDSEIRILS